VLIKPAVSSGRGIRSNYRSVSIGRPRADPFLHCARESFSRRDILSETAGRMQLLAIISGTRRDHRRASRDSFCTRASLSDRLSNRRSLAHRPRVAVLAWSARTHPNAPIDYLSSADFIRGRQNTSAHFAETNTVTIALAPSGDR